MGVWIPTASARQRKVDLADTLEAQLRQLQVDPRPTREYPFAAPERRWRIDLAWPGLLLAAEVDGGSFVWGRHSRGRGMHKDLEKLNRLALDGWRVFRFDTLMITDWSAAELLQRVVSQYTHADGYPR